ncbi:unnamed protein product [Amoebophrya sp. A120]|nr:unnamed protein product [Amoebophrya sp. A120]|eukprot:GSA120T00002142001.1
MGCASSKQEKAAEAAPAAAAPPQMAAEPAKPAEAAADGPSTFYVVDHTFKPDCKAEDWWTAMTPFLSDPEKLKGMFSGNSGNGFYNHAFIPMAQDHICCIWECKAGVKEADLQTLLDDSVGQKMMVNKLMVISPELTGGQMPFAAAYAKDSKLSMELNATYASSASQWYIVKHDMKEGKADEWWADTAKMMADQEAYAKFTQDGLDKGFANHSFMPVSKDLAYCVWECKEAGMEDGLQAHLDEQVGRGCFVNTVIATPGELSGNQRAYAPKFNTE